MEHSELIAEMSYIEKLSTQERLKLARRRRMQQLKKFSQRDKEINILNKKEKTAHNEAKKNQRSPRVYFASNIIILEAAARNDIDEVKELLEMGIDPDSTNEDGLTALHQCCIDDSEEMMRLLVHYGANGNAQDSEKWTPLHAAATCGHLHLAKFLISKGANLLAVNADGNMPYDICEDDATLDYIESEMASRGITQQLIDDTRAAVERKMLEELKEQKAEGHSLMYRDEHGATPLHVAAANGYILVVEYLLSQNMPTEVQDNDDWSPLHAAACWGHPDVLEMLVQHGANLQAKTKNQETPYDVCEDAELRERIMQLVNEQETRRLNDQNRRIRRVRSNKRTQSIRRTSVREKTLTPKKEAQEEARLRIHLENKCFENTSLPDVCRLTQQNAEETQEKRQCVDVDRSTGILKQLEEDENMADEFVSNEAAKEKTTVFESRSELDASPQPQPATPLSSNISVTTSSHDIRGQLEPSSSSAVGECEPVHGPPIPPPRSSSAVVGVTEGGKIDIHVTVTVNPFSPGTLSDLKKQRALSRATQNSFTLGSSSHFSLNTSNSDADPSFASEHAPSQPLQPPSVATATSVTGYSPQPSPSQSPRRFCGELSDMMGKKEPIFCCAIM